MHSDAFKPTNAHYIMYIPAVSFALPPQTISTGTVTTVPSPASTDTAAAYVRLHAMAIALCLL